MTIVFAISGVFGSGKSSVANLACRGIDDLDSAIPYTSRARHAGDSRDNEFFFTSREVFERMIAREEFLEYVSISGNYYGTPRHYLERAQENGRDLLIQVDNCGVAQLKQKISGVVSVLVLPGQLARDTRISGSAIDPRASSLLQEASLPSQMPNYDMYDHVIVDDRLEDSASRLIEIIRSERSRRS